MVVHCTPLGRETLASSLYHEQLKEKKKSFKLQPVRCEGSEKRASCDAASRAVHLNNVNGDGWRDQDYSAEIGAPDTGQCTSICLLPACLTSRNRLGASARACPQRRGTVRPRLRMGYQTASSQPRPASSSGLAGEASAGRATHHVPVTSGGGPTVSARERAAICRTLLCGILLYSLRLGLFALCGAA